MRKVMVASGVLLSMLLSGCVSQDEHNKVLEENKNLQKQIEQLKNEVANLKSKNIETEERLALYRKETGAVPVANNNESLTLEQEYINNFLKLYDFEARYYDSYLEENIPGCTFKIKNKGNKTVTDIEVTVYFKDKNGNTIAEEKYNPVLDVSLSDYKELKPNYTWQQEEDKFYAAKTVSKDDWVEGKAEAKITAIKFKD